MAQGLRAGSQGQGSLQASSVGKEPAPLSEPPGEQGSRLHLVATCHLHLLKSSLFTRM